MTVTYCMLETRIYSDYDTTTDICLKKSLELLVMELRKIDKTYSRIRYLSSILRKPIIKK